MTAHSVFRTSTFLLAIAAAGFAMPPLASQAATPHSSVAKVYQPPRMADGKPSLEGTWSNATLTSLQRPARFKSLVIPDNEVQALTDSNPEVVRQRTDDKQNSNTVLNGSDLNSGRGYNAFWIDPGMTYSNVKGEYRSSFIVDPANGQIPYKQGMRATRGGVRGGFDGPEVRPLGERCIINSGSAGPPMMTYLYNNNYEIAQTHDTLLIRVEMNNYARLVRIGGKHTSENIKPFHGDSIGHWEGDTLVVETTHFHPLHNSGMIPLTTDAKVIERFTRYSKDQILYEFTVDDAEHYTQAWRGEMSFNAMKEHVYEYACHEGNYALVGTLAGAREIEKRAAAKPKQ